MIIQKACALGLPKNAAYVTMSTVRTMPTETSIIPRTIFDLALGIDVKERAFFVVACIKSRIEITLGHFGHIVLV